MNRECPGTGIDTSLWGIQRDPDFCLEKGPTNVEIVRATPMNQRENDTTRTEKQKKYRNNRFIRGKDRQDFPMVQ